MRRLGWLAAFLALQCGGADGVPDLGHIREANLDRATKLPDFVVDETALRYAKSKGETEWRLTDRVEAEIAVHGKGGFNRRNVRVNGQLWPLGKEFPEWDWNVAFGDELRGLFDPQCKTQIEFEGPEQWYGQPALAYRFRSPANACFGNIGTRASFFRRYVVVYNPARSGEFLVDGRSNLVRSRFEATGFPKEFKNDTWTEETSWNYVLIGQQTYLLPVAFDIEVGSSKGSLWKAHVEYRNHRHFEASTKVEFK